MRALCIAATILVLCPAEGQARAEACVPTTTTFAMHDSNQMVGYRYGQAQRTLLIAIHGASDTHTVFDFSPGFRAACRWAQAGLAVLTVDRVGYGASSHPDGDSLDFLTSAGYVHELVQAVRGGALGWVPDHVILLGPSAGADIIMVEAGTYHDVDGLVVSFNSANLQPALYAVDVNAWFAQGPYFDFGVDFRTDFFYAQPWAPRWIIALDNATRALVPRAEIQSALASASAPYRALIDVPVLLMQAELDHIFIPEDDSALFSAAPSVEFKLLSRTGHKAFLHPTAKHTAVATVSDWVAAHF